MGRRAIIIDRRNDDRFNCRYAQWGAVADPIAQSQPLGTDWTAETVLHTIDATIETLLVRNGQSYCVCWLDPTLTDPNDIAIAYTADIDALRAWWTEVKSRAVGAVADGHTPERVRDTLLTALTGRAKRVYTDDASFLFTDG
jgi:hypothetical protein